MRIGIVSVFVDYHRRGAHHRGVLQPQVGPLIAALVPPDAEIDIINDAWTDPDWERDYDLMFISALHSDFDRARQISHYYRSRGAKTVFGGAMASAYPDLVRPYFDSIIVGDPEATVPAVCADFVRNALAPLYRAPRYDGARVPVPRLDLCHASQVLPLALEVSRGCPFACDFCVLTGLGTRFETRPVTLVARDITAVRRMLAGRVSRHKLGLAVFYDNNIGGNFAYLRELCAAIKPLGIRWGSSITFNAASNRSLVETMADSGCRFLYVGLESFNPGTLAGMNKRHNVLPRVREVIDGCRRAGILLTAGQMLSPLTDDCDYIDRLPDLLSGSGLHVPSYVCFETPIPGTPLFERLAAEPEPALLPGALLRDFTTYTLVVRPRRASANDFVDAYRRLLSRVYAWPRRARKLVDDIPRLLRSGRLLGAALDVFDQYHEDYRPDAGRTYLAGSDREPPEVHGIPFRDGDFRDEAQRRAILEPWAVTDADGRVLPMWHAAARGAPGRRPAARGGASERLPEAFVPAVGPVAVPT